MRVVSLDLQHISRLLLLEEEMYWQQSKWKDLWEEEAKEKFRVFIEDYMTNNPQGCFGVVDDNDQLLGAMFLTKVSELKPIPYLHRFADYFEEDGEIAYVSFFVVKRGKEELEIAEEVYDQAEEVALFKLKCKTISVVIYSSPIELKILQSHNYEKLNEQFEWEIYPGMKKECWIYYYNLLMERGN